MENVFRKHGSVFEDARRRSRLAGELQYSGRGLERGVSCALSQSQARVWSQRRNGFLQCANIAQWVRAVRALEWVYGELGSLHGGGGKQLFQHEVFIQLRDEPKS